MERGLSRQPESGRPVGGSSMAADPTAGAGGLQSAAASAGAILRRADPESLHTAHRSSTIIFWLTAQLCGHEGLAPLCERDPWIGKSRRPSAERARARRGIHRAAQLTAGPPTTHSA